MDESENTIIWQYTFHFGIMVITHGGTSTTSRGTIVSEMIICENRSLIQKPFRKKKSTENHTGLNNSKNIRLPNKYDSYRFLSFFFSLSFSSLSLLCHHLSSYLHLPLFISTYYCLYLFLYFSHFYLYLYLSSLFSMQCVKNVNRYACEKERKRKNEKHEKIQN